MNLTTHLRGGDMRARLSVYVFFLLIMIFGVANVACALEVTQQWMDVPADPVSWVSSGHSIAVDNEGNAYVAGPSIYYYGNYISPKYITLRKYDKEGNELWYRDNAVSISPGTVDYADVKTFLDNAGNIYVVHPALNTIVFKYNPDGDLLWSTTFMPSGASSIYKKGVAFDEQAGAIYLSSCLMHTWTISQAKIDSSGALAWEYRTGDATRSSQLLPVLSKDRETVYLIRKGYPSVGDHIIKLDKNGNLIQDKTIPASLGIGTIRDADIDDYENLYITGSLTDSYRYVAKFDSNGDLQWLDDPKTNYDLSASKIRLDNEGNVVVASSKYGIKQQLGQLCYACIHLHNLVPTVITKYDNNGNQLWEDERTEQTSTADYLNIDANGNIFLTGLGALKWDYFTMVYDKNGVLLQTLSPGAPYDYLTFPLDAVLDRSGNLYVTGATEYTWSSVMTIKYSSLAADPTASAGPDQTVECGSPEGSVVTLDGTASTDPSDSELTYSWSGPFGIATGANPSVTLPLGTSTVTLTVTNATGQSATDTVDVTVQDTTPPSTSVILTGTPGQNDWYISAVDVALSSTDSCTGVKEIRYSINSVEQAAVTGAKASFTLGQDGVYNVKYWATDNAGNIAAPHSTEPISTVTTPPATDATPAGTVSDGGYYTSCVNVTLNVTTDLSGLSYTEYSTDGGISWQRYAGQFSICAPGATDITYRSVSNAGNVETPKTITVNIDKTAPVSSLALGGTTGDNGWYASGVTLSMSAADATAGVREIRYAIDGVEYVSAGGSATALVSPDGAHTVVYYSVDNAGNIEAARSVSFSIDATPPVVTISGVVEGGLYTLGSVPVADYQATDALSGMASDSSALQGGDGLGLGDFTYTVTATDNAGNVTSIGVGYSVGATSSGTVDVVNQLEGSGQIDATAVNSLVSKLENAASANNSTAASGKLEAFINETNAQYSAGRITESARDMLINAANYAIAHLP